MGKTGLEKAFGKMFPENMGPAVKIVQPVVSARMSKEERQALGEGVASSSVPVSPAVPAVPALVGQAVPDEHRKQGKGRPKKESTEGKMVLMNFRVSESFRQKIKRYAVEHGVSVIDVFEEALTKLMEN